MKNKDAVQRFSSIRDVVIQDLITATDDELREEARQRGDNFSAIANKARGLVQNAVASVHRQRLDRVRQEMKMAQLKPPSLLSRPPIEKIKEIIGSLFRTDSSLQLAFRNGKVQTDEELFSMYDDLVRLGKINPTTNED